MQEWDFYPCRVDGEPAIVTVDLSWRRRSRPAGLDLRVAVLAEMLEPGPAGVGTTAERLGWTATERAIERAAGVIGLVFVGSVRTAGRWAMTLYGDSVAAGQLTGLVRSQVDPRRSVQCMGGADPSWRHYDEVLYPDPERYQWMMDRRTVDQLRAAGDSGTHPRPIDHVGVVATGGVDGLSQAAAALGFAAVVRPLGEQAEVRLTRVDGARLAALHETVMGLIELFAAHGGAYEGWGSPVAARRPAADPPGPPPETGETP